MTIAGQVRTEGSSGNRGRLMVGVGPRRYLPCKGHVLPSSRADGLDRHEPSWPYFKRAPIAGGWCCHLHRFGGNTRHSTRSFSHAGDHGEHVGKQRRAEFNRRSHSCGTGRAGRLHHSGDHPGHRPDEGEADRPVRHYVSGGLVSVVLLGCIDRLHCCRQLLGDHSG